MSITKWVFVSILAVIILTAAVGFWLYPQPDTDSQHAAVTPEESPAQHEAPAFLKERAREVLGEHAAQKPIQRDIPPEEAKQWEQDIDAKARTLAAANQAINFYGRILDQDDQPIPDVDIAATINYFSPLIPLPAFGTVRLRTDDQGAFTLRNEKGVSLTLEANKDGYRFNRLSLDYLSGRASQLPGATPDNPYTLRGFSLAAVLSHDVVTLDKLYFLPLDGSYVTIDLLSGAIKKGKQDGDLWVSAYREPGAQRQGKFDWRLIVESSGGGLLETTDRLRYLAPSHGYQPVWTLAHDKTDPAWHLIEQKQFYAVSRDGAVYSQFYLVARSFYNRDGMFAIGIQSAANPTGARALYNGKN